MTSLSDIRAALARLRSGLHGWALAAGSLALAAFVLWLALIFALADLAFQLPAPWCWTGFVTLLAGTGLLAVLTGRQVTRHLSDEHLSVRVEQARPEFRNRLINVVQFAAMPDARDQEFAQQLLAEAPLPLAAVQAGDLFPRHLVRTAAWMALAAALLTAGLLALSPQGYLTSLLRLAAPFAGIPPFTLTHIAQLTPGDSSLPRGDKVEVRVHFTGKVPLDHVQLTVRGQRDEQWLVPLTPTAEDKAVFVGLTPPLYVDAEYWVTGGDARSPHHHLAVDSPPALAAWTAKVQAPAYTGLPAATLVAGKEQLNVPAGSTVTFTLTATLPLKLAEVLQQETVLGSVAGSSSGVPGTNKDATVTFTAPAGGVVAARLTAARGLVGTVPLPFVLVADQAPTVEFVGTEGRLLAAPDAVLPLNYHAADEYGVRTVTLERVNEDKTTTSLGEASANGPRVKELSGRFVLDLGPLKLVPPAAVRVRLAAIDFGPDTATRRGLSRVLEIVVPLQEDRDKLRAQAQTDARASLTKMIRLQQDNLKLTHAWEEKVAKGTPLPADGAQTLLANQTQVRAMAQEVLKRGDPLGDLQPVVDRLTQGEMLQAVAACDLLTRAPAKEMEKALHAAADLENKILSQLLGMPTALDSEQKFKVKADLLALLEKMTRVQHENLVKTQTAQTEKQTGDAVTALVATEEKLGDDANAFLAQAAKAITETAKDDFVTALTAANKVLVDGKLYEKMVGATDQLQKLDWPAAVQSEEESQKLLLMALDILNKWRVNQAKEKVKELANTLKDLANKLNEAEEKQKKVVETTKDLAKRETIDEPLKEQLTKAAKEQKEWKDALEKMAQDLYQFPDLPVANELNSKMRELFEDVEQAKDSDKAPATEVAVQKEDSLLDAIAATKKRVEDIEMWLPDAPDNIKWDLESFDAKEFPKMPLVPLPDELEDMVGNLLDQAQQEAEKSQDSTGNQMTADAEMGWGVGDGPMPNFSAKGKSGNTKPNDNEMTGRSGSGREGQSNGELAENKVTGLEGTETHARRTNDPNQKGQVTEADDSTLKAKATGGGKLGGESETVGMFGQGERRDLAMGRADNLKQLRQETEALYTTARLLYLPNTRTLGAVSQEMRSVEHYDDKMKRFESLQQKVVKRLQDSQVEVATGAVLAMPVTAKSSAGGAAMVEDVNLNDIKEEYRDVVSDYFKNLGH